MEGNPKKVFCNVKCKNDYGNNKRKVERICKTYYCVQCGKELIGKHHNIKFCSKECRDIYLLNKHNQTFENKEHCICAICGWKAESLLVHINNVHKISLLQYQEKHNKTLDDVITKSCRKKWGDKLKGKNNPAYGHNGKYSPYSKNFIGYNDLTDNEKNIKIQKLHKKQSESSILNQNNPNQIGYWIKQGYTESEAREKVSNRQSTFSKEKCIERYGDIEGKHVWKERQEKWQKVLKSKAPEEIERINRAKMDFKGYSKISQKLFWEIYNQIKNKYKKIYFAELGSKKNNEYMLLTDDKKCIFFDFYIKDINKVIEFDGDYWHGKKRGNQKRDEIRNEKIINKGIQVYHVLERDYKNNQNNVVKECLNFIWQK